MIKKFIVFGSGGFAKEVIDIVLSDGHEVVGVVSTENFNNEKYNEFPVFKTVPNHIEHDGYLLGVADSKLKRKFVNENLDNWVTFIHSSVHLSKFSTIGKGCIICPQAQINADCVIGNFVTLNNYTLIAHDAIVGDYSTFSPYSGIMGNSSVGEDCFFGTAAYSIPKVKLGNRIKVSAGSMVRHSYSFECTLQGNPAKPRQ